MVAPAADEAAHQADPQVGGAPALGVDVCRGVCVLWLVWGKRDDGAVASVCVYVCVCKDDGKDGRTSPQTEEL